MPRILAVVLVAMLGAATLVVVAAPHSSSAAATGDSYGLVDPSNGVWHLYENSTEVGRFYFGNPGDYPFMGDWDCDGDDTPGLYRQSDGYVYLRNENTQGNADISFFFGNPGDVPVAGDFNADGCDTVSIYRPSNQTFYIINKLGTADGGLGAADYSFMFGNPGDKPFTGDFNGNGQDTVGLHRESSGLVYFRNTNTTGNADNQFIFGNPGDRFVAGDWTGNGVDSPGLFRPSDTTMYLRYENTQGNADESWTVGQNAWLPVAGAFGDNIQAPPTTPPALKQLVLKDGNDLVVMNQDGSGRTVLSAPSRTARWYPTWSPDGSRIAYTHSDYDNEENDGIYIMNADGSNPTRLVNDAHAAVGDWAPDGLNIVFNSPRVSASDPTPACSNPLSCDQNLFTVNVVSGAIRQVTYYEAFNWEATYSPDGTKIAFTSSLDNDWEIFTINLTGTGLTQITFNDEGDGAPAWTPDSRGLVYRGYTDGQSDLWFTRFGSAEQRLTSDPKNDDYPAVASDGTIAFARDEGSFTGDVIYLITTDGHITSTGQQGFQPDWRP